MLGLVLVVLGSLLATAAILSLGRSFRIEPAHRGLQTRRLYRVVRHPIYASYLPIVGGFLLSYASWWNGLVAVIWLAVQITRIQREEALLSQDCAVPALHGAGAVAGAAGSVVRRSHTGQILIGAAAMALTTRSARRVIHFAGLAASLDIHPHLAVDGVLQLPAALLILFGH